MDEWARCQLVYPDGRRDPVGQEQEEEACLDIVVILFCAGVCGLALASMVMSAGIWASLSGLPSR